MSALAQVSPAPINWKSAIGIAVAGLLGVGVYWAATSPRLRVNRRRRLAANIPAWIQTARAYYVVGSGPEYLIKQVATGGAPPANMVSGPHRTWHGAQTAHKRLTDAWRRRPVTPNSMRREMDVLVRRAREQGWTVEKTGGGHWKFKAPAGGKIIYTSATPSDWRAMKNALSDLRRAGFKENPRRRVSANKRKKMSELGVYDAIGVIRSEKPRGQLGFMPPALVSQLRRSPRGLYKFGLGAKKGWTLTRFKTASLRGAMTSTRIASTSSGEMHWLVDNEDPHYPVLVRLVDKSGHSAYRVEEFAKRFERVPETVERRRASSR